MNPLGRLAGLVLLVGCAAGPASPASDIPVSVQPRQFYAAESVAVRPDAGEVSVAGKLLLARGYSIPRGFSAHVRFIGTDGRLLADVPARLDRAAARYRGDPCLDASFSTVAAIHFDAVGRIEVTFDRWPKA